MPHSGATLDSGEFGVSLARSDREALTGDVKGNMVPLKIGI